MSDIQERIVYVLRSDADPSRHYVGITGDVRERLEWHNHGPSGHTVLHRPWSLAVSMEFPTEGDARRFEEYLKSGSGRAFAARHFGAVASLAGSGSEHTEERIAELKRRAEQAAGGRMMAWESDTLRPEEKEEFWRRVVEFEEAPCTTNFQQLLDAGLQLPAPDALDDHALHAKLWEVIGALALLRVFISETDHLDDRQVYTWLWSHALREEVEDVPAEDAGVSHLSVLGGWSNEDTLNYLKYYADERCREDWLKSVPDFEVPPHEGPPYDRDAHLPRPTDSCAGAVM